MSRAFSFVLILILGLAFLTWIASGIVSRTTRGWAERDLALRARLAFNGARHALLSYWESEDWSRMRSLLTEIAHDERILAAAAYGLDFSRVASTPDFPEQVDLRQVMQGVPAPSQTPAEWQPWASLSDLPGGKVHLTSLPVVDDSNALGFLLLVHDLSFIERREAKTTQFLLGAFGILALSASVVTLVAARLSWKGWNRAMRQLLQWQNPLSAGSAPPPEFQPLLRDVRELVQRISSEKDSDTGGGTWTPQRLREVLQRNLEGERVVILANREPYIHERAPDGTVSVLRPASGLVTSLEPVLEACSGVWVAHGSGSADRETADPSSRLKVPPGQGSYTLRRVWLSPEEEQGYYYGFANEGLWPLCHIAHARPTFRSSDWQHYQAVNQKFAEAVCAEVDLEDPIILVQDYHFALAPQMIRERLPRSTILTFWHIPWPNYESFGICPWQDELLHGLLGSSILGFHTQRHCNNFLDAVDSFMEARVDREEIAVVHQKRTTLIRAHPISVEWPNRLLAELPPAAECRAEVLAQLHLEPDALIGVGVDRLDYTKGIEERFLAVERLLERQESLRGRFTFVQVAAPSRSAIERYRQLDDRVQALAARINERFSQGSYRPIVLLRAHHGRESVFRYYRAADFCYVSSLHDGMNLVAKEFVSARDDERGVLVLSLFTGAARELTEALIVNPYDLEEASAGLIKALAMPLEEQRDRMRAMRSFLAEFNVYRWAGRMLVDAARLRRRDRLSGRLKGRARARMR